MDSGTRFLTFTSILMLALILQVVLAVADQRDTPEKAAVEFAEAYFWLEPAMSERLCREIASAAKADPVALFLERKENEARASGFPPRYMKQGIYHVDARTLENDGETARVLLRGERRRTINPVYGLIARWFAVGETHPVEETLVLKKEAGAWKVCGRPFQLLEG